MSQVSTRSGAAFALLAAGLLSLTACAKPLDVTVPETLVDPGTTVALGETVRVPGSAYEVRDDGRYVAQSEVGLTVAEVKYEDEGWFKELNNPEDFAGYTPVLVSTQANIPADSEFESPSAASPYGVLDNGEYTEYLSLDGFKSSAEFCWGSNYGASSAEHKMDCTVLLVPEGAALASLEWDGQSVNGGLVADDPAAAYIENPLTFELPAAE
ncbi:hypothetical protein GCM10028820_01600 [Tessaracoccus terricola]